MGAVEILSLRLRYDYDGLKLKCNSVASAYPHELHRQHFGGVSGREIEMCLYNCNDSEYKRPSSKHSSFQIHDDDDDDQSLKLALRQPWVRNVSDFIFLVTAYEDRWLPHHLIFPLTVCSQCTYSS